MEVVPPQATAGVDEEIVFAAVARDRNGHSLEREMSWSVDDDAVASIGPSGTLVTLAGGIVTVTAETSPT